MKKKLILLASCVVISSNIYGMEQIASSSVGIQNYKLYENGYTEATLSIDEQLAYGLFPSAVVLPQGCVFVQVLSYDRVLPPDDRKAPRDDDSEKDSCFDSDSSLSEDFITIREEHKILSVLAYNCTNMRSQGSLKQEEECEILRNLLRGNNNEITPPIGSQHKFQDKMILSANEEMAYLQKENDWLSKSIRALQMRLGATKKRLNCKNLIKSRQYTAIYDDYSDLLIAHKLDAYWWILQGNVKNTPGVSIPLDEVVRKVILQLAESEVKSIRQHIVFDKNAEQDLNYFRIKNNNLWSSHTRLKIALSKASFKLRVITNNLTAQDFEALERLRIWRHEDNAVYPLY